MATRRHGIVHEVRGWNATEGYGAPNLHALMRAPRWTRAVADVAAPRELEAARRGEPNAEGLGECGHNDEETEMLRKEGILIE